MMPNSKQEMSLALLGNYGTLANELTQTIGKMSCLALASAQDDKDMSFAIGSGLSDLHQDIVDGTLAVQKVVTRRI